MEIVIYNDFETGLQAFTRKVRGSGLLKELRLREFYETRSQRRKRKDREALKRLKKDMKKRERRHERFKGMPA